MCTFAKIPGFDYSIDVDGNLWHIPTGDIVSPINGNVSINSPMGTLSIGLSNLLIYTFLVGNRDLSLLWRIVPLYLDGNEANHKLDNLCYRFDNTVGPLIGQWYPIPYFTHYLTNGNGEIVRAKDLLPLTLRIDSNGYMLCSLRRDLPHGRSKGHATGYHRIHAMTFIEYPAWFNELHVNHIDGEKLNNTTTNLEWVTPRENIMHAVKMGLRSDNIKVLARSVITEEVKEFYSITECARFFGVAHNTMLQRLSKNDQPIWPELHQFKYSHDQSPWRIPVNIKNELSELKRRLPVMALNIFTGVVTTYADAASAEKHTECGEGVVRWKLDKAKELMPINGFLFQYEHNYSQWPSYNEFQLEYFKKYPKKPPLPVRCRDMLSNCITDYFSVENAAEQLDINTNSIKTGIRSGCVVKKRYRFEYIDVNMLKERAQ